MITEPESMEELVYFTNRTLGDKGKVMAWVYRKDCPECGKAKMGKPKKSDGGVKIRASEYECPECSYNVPKQEYEDTLDLQAKYTCPECEFSGTSEVPFKRKKVKGVETIQINCGKCNAIIDITKKMKEKK